MNNSTTIGRNSRRNATISDTIITTAWICSLIIAVGIALTALTVWVSPLVFFVALGAALLCIDPLRKHLRQGESMRSSQLEL